MTHVLTLKLSKHKDAKGFRYIHHSKSEPDIDALKAEVCDKFTKLYGTPVKCTKVTKDDN